MNDWANIFSTRKVRPVHRKTSLHRVYRSGAKPLLPECVIAHITTNPHSCRIPNCCYHVLEIAGNARSILTLLPLTYCTDVNCPWSDCEKSAKRGTQCFRYKCMPATKPKMCIRNFFLLQGFIVFTFFV